VIRNLLYLAAFGIGAWLVAGVYLAGRDEQSAPPNNIPAIFQGGAAAGQRIDSRSWSASYDKMVANADQTQLELDGVHDGIIYKKGKPYLLVRARHMTVNTITHDFSARGPIHVETASGNPKREFDSTAADWSDSTQKLSLPEPIEIRSGAKEPLFVGSLEFNVRTGEIELHYIRGAVRFH
jgi:hypothetical protein